MPLGPAHLDEPEAQNAAWIKLSQDVFPKVGDTIGLEGYTGVVVESRTKNGMKSVKIKAIKATRARLLRSYQDYENRKMHQAILSAYQARG